MSNSILDSEKIKFSTGAVRNSQEDKGRFDLVPLDVIADIMEMNGVRIEYANVLRKIERYKETKDAMYLEDAILWFCKAENMSFYDMLHEVSMHYKICLKDYPEDNWKQGIPLKSYLSSGTRHLCKHIYGHEDEPHHRGFIWNILGALWTIKHKPELIDAPFDMEEFKEVENAR